MGRLNHGKIRALREPGRYADGGTLYLRVAPGGSKSWIQRATINGRRRDIGLGGWPVVSLARARERAFANRVAVSEGRDPLAEKRRASMPTFRAAAAQDVRGEPTALAQRQDGEELGAATGAARLWRSSAIKRVDQIDRERTCCAS